MGIKLESLASRTKKMRNQRQVDESGELKDQIFSSPAILALNGNDQDAEQLTVMKSRMDNIPRLLFRV
ncbi:uncharacterized protein FPRN_14203 [Fusarium proliferatum]|nr:uncharacterized protein FPRN_14203 [Fusarium proliferatum]